MSTAANDYPAPGWRLAGARWLKFNFVGALGIAVQLAVLGFLTGCLRADYGLATAAAVECAVLHNFVWHQRFTWADRPGATWRQILRRLARFNLTTGATSITGNVLLMQVLVERLHLPLMLANLASIALCCVVNFLVSDRFVFNKSGNCVIG